MLGNKSVKLNNLKWGIALLLAFVMLFTGCRCLLSDSNETVRKIIHKREKAKVSRLYKMDSQNPLKCTCVSFSTDKYLSSKMVIYLTNKGRKPLHFDKGVTYGTDFLKDTSEMLNLANREMIFTGSHAGITCWEDIDMPSMVIEPDETKIVKVTTCPDIDLYHEIHAGLEREGKLDEKLGFHLGFNSKSISCNVNNLSVTGRELFEAFDKTWGSFKGFFKSPKSQCWYECCH